MIDQVLVTERDADDALQQQGPQIVLDVIGGAPVAETGGEALGQPDRPRLTALVDNRSR